MLARMWSNRSSYSLLMGTQNGTATLKDSSAISGKIKHTLTIWYSNCFLVLLCFSLFVWSVSLSSSYTFHLIIIAFLCSMLENTVYFSKGSLSLQWKEWNSSEAHIVPWQLSTQKIKQYSDTWLLEENWEKKFFFLRILFYLFIFFLLFIFFN